MRDDVRVPTPQSQDQIAALCDALVGQRITLLQVLGINALKSLRPSPDDLVGERIEAVDVSGRIVTFSADAHTVTIDLQRTGKLVALSHPQPYLPGTGSMPTVRLITEGGGLDLTEPAKTKRISVSLADRVK